MPTPTPTPDDTGYYKQEDLLDLDYTPPKTDWMDTPADIHRGSYIYPGKAKNLKILDLPNPRDWAVEDDDWKLPENWKEIIIEGMADRLKKYRSFRIFMDICVRCGACADKCHFSSAAAIRKTCPSSGPSCSGRSTARISRSWERSSAK